MTDPIDAAIEAQWDAIPCHVPWRDYIASHPRRDEVLATMRRITQAGVDAYLAASHPTPPPANLGGPDWDQAP